MHAVTKDTLIKRINRKLAPKHERLCTSRRGGERDNLGEHHLIDAWRNAVIDWYISEARIVELARELGVMHAHETIVP